MNNLVFHIGYHKTATTWLQQVYFSKHPEINLIANYKQPWNDEFLYYLINTTEGTFSASYCRELLSNKLLHTEDNDIRKNVVSAERLSGHPYSGGYDSYTLAERIHFCFPKSKIIIGIRNQVKMIPSVYQQLVREGYLGTFSDLLKSKHWKGTAFSMDMYKYDCLINKYFDLFSRANTLVVFYEDLVQNYKKYVSRISKFLNVADFNVSSMEGKVNKGKQAGQIILLRWLNYFRKTELNPFPIMKLKQSYLIKLSNILSPIVRKSLVQDEEVNYLREYYAESNERLRNILQRDLPEYP